MKKIFFAIVFGVAFLLSGNFITDSEAQSTGPDGHPVCGDTKVNNMFISRKDGFCIEFSCDCIGLDPVILEF